MADAAGQALEEPHMGTGRSQLDMAEALTADLRQSDFHAALVADDAAVLHALVLAAQALPVGDRAEDAGAEQAVTLGLEGTVIDRLRLGDFAVRPAPDLLGRGQADTDSVEISDRISEIERTRTVQSCLQCAAERCRQRPRTAVASSQVSVASRALPASTCGPCGSEHRCTSLKITKSAKSCGRQLLLPTGNWQLTTES